METIKIVEKYGTTEIEVDTYKDEVKVEITPGCTYCDTIYYTYLTKEQAISLGESLISHAKSIKT